MFQEYPVMKIQPTQGKITFAEGVSMCESQDTRIATYEELEMAHDAGTLSCIPSLHKKTSSLAHGDLKITHIRSPLGHDEVMCRQGIYTDSISL